MGQFEEDCKRKGLVAVDIKNAIIVNFWLLAWAVSLGVISYFSELNWYSATWIKITGFVINCLIGVGMIFAFKRFVSKADELERKIQLEALALSVGVTLVFFSSYSILQISFEIADLSPSYLIVAMSLGYAIGLIMGRKRFR
jgi:hypothetical protein